MSEYATLTKDIEESLNTSFNPHLVHHLVLMFMDKHIHFHIIPRYTEAINFAGTMWEDDNIPDPLIQNRDQVQQNVLNQIRDVIKSNLSNTN